MGRTSFHAWMEHRVEEVPDATTLALLIARSGAGVSSDDLGRLAGVSSETLQDLLRALVASGQVVVLKVNGRLVYRATT